MTMVSAVGCLDLDLQIDVVREDGPARERLANDRRRRLIRERR